MKKFLAKCAACGATTSAKYARDNQGRCKTCVTGVPQPSRTRETNEERQGRIIDSGWAAYAREEGHYDTYD